MQNKYYKTIETTAINPNFLIYNYKIDPFITRDNKNFNWQTSESDYKNYNLGNGNTIKMFDTTSGDMTEQVNKGLNFYFNT
ncbi:hypothetical protein PL321_10565 [Caloramator sp. mosi_1]|uniref:hypothetical protein n=1 Tax=Caloramator sp. mosi_1 TaxID=3023090 RepID=UPI002362ED6F|nr:hypothetical protein [Caloramator sp. mosi_1]WDC83233.1 hypothetical protein PL321_10565 [Caloramator sp. mosi_1]